MKGIKLLPFLLTLLIMGSCTHIHKALIYQKPNIDDYKIFENRNINAGNYQPWLFAENYNAKQIPETKRSSFGQYKTVAYLIAQDNKLVHEEYWDNYSDSSLSNSFSAAKSIVSLLIGIAIDDGKIKSVDESICTYLPELKKQGCCEVTIKDVLTMSSGMCWDERYSGLSSNITKAYYGNNLSNLVYKLKPVTKSGMCFNYSSINTQVLAMILETTTGKSISEYTSEKLWQPIGTKHEALWSLDRKNGIEKSYCCFNSNARDFARIGQLCLDNGKWNGQQIVSENYLNEAFTSANYLKDKEGNPVDYYGYQWWLMNYKGLHIKYARGILGQYIFIIPEKNAIVVRLGHKRSDEKINHTPTDVFIWLDTALEILD